MLCQVRAHCCGWVGECLCRRDRVCIVMWCCGGLHTVFVDTCPGCSGGGLELPDVAGWGYLEWWCWGAVLACDGAMDGIDGCCLTG